ncbi:hypothetical protein [Prevotella dentasini]|uniref:hypothetical protein n=1 Tax=Prevotella dentasini TaxID=589537 RepID=UPI000ADEAFEE|nr:hypothetical protein [Prevotella dentasini]
MTLFKVNYKIYGHFHRAIFNACLMMVVALAALSCANHDEDDPGVQSGEVGYMLSPPGHRGQAAP